MKRRINKKKAFDKKNEARRMDIEHLKEFIGRGGTYSNVSIQRKMKEEQVLHYPPCYSCIRTVLSNTLK